MKVENLKVNENITDKKIKLKHQMSECRDNMIIQGLLTGGCAGVTMFMFSNNPDIVVTGAMIILSFVGAYGLGINASEYSNLKNEEKKLIKKAD